MAMNGEGAVKLWEGYEAAKRNTWDRVFWTCDRYYYGFSNPKTWPGQKTFRNDPQIRTVMKVCESIIPSLMFNLVYAGGPGKFFSILKGSDPERAKKAEDRVFYLLSAPDKKGETGFSVIGDSLRPFVRYGLTTSGIRFDRRLGRAKLVGRTPRQVYWSPSAGPWIDSSPSIISRSIHYVSDVEQYGRMYPSKFRIPSKSKLVEIAKATMNNQAEEEASTTAAKYMGSRPSNQDVDHLRNLGDDFLKLPVMEVETENDILWIIGNSQRYEVIYKAPNIFGVKSTCGACYLPSIDYFGGEGIAHLAMVEQRLQQRFIGLVLDWMDLSVLPPQMQKRSHRESQQLAPWGPSAMLEQVEDKVNGPVQIPPVPPELFQMLSLSEGRLSSQTGVNQLQMTGVPTPSNANRTIGGVEAQRQGGEARQFGPLFQLETKFMVPILTKLLIIDQLGREAFSMNKVPARNTSTGELYEVDTADLPRSVELEILSSSRLMSRQALAPHIPIVLQYLMNPQILQLAQSQGQTLDFQQINAFVNESTGTAKLYEFFRNLSDEERQSMLQSPEVQQGQQDTQARLQVSQDKKEIEMAKLQAKIKELDGKESVEILKLLQNSIKEKEVKSGSSSS